MDNFRNQDWNKNQQNSQSQEQFGFNTQNQQQQTSNQQVNQPQPSIMMKLMSSCLPVLLEQFTGQSIPPMGGSTAETQLVLSQVLTLQQQIVANQNALNQRLASLENNAVQQFTNLTNQVQSIKSIRLSHSKETKSIDYDLNQAGQKREFNQEFEN